MIDEKKVAIMTALQAYDDRDGKQDSEIVNYFRSDYIGFQILKSILSATIAFLLVFGLYVAYDYEKLMGNIYQMDLIAAVKNLCIIYLISVGAYIILTYLVYVFRYAGARKRLKKYFINLKNLSRYSDTK